MAQADDNQWDLYSKWQSKRHGYYWELKSLQQQSLYKLLVAGISYYNYYCNQMAFLQLVMILWPQTTTSTENITATKITIMD